MPARFLGRKRVGATSSYQQGEWSFLLQFYTLGRSVRVPMNKNVPLILKNTGWKPFPLEEFILIVYRVKRQEEKKFFFFY